MPDENPNIAEVVYHLDEAHKLLTNAFDSWKGQLVFGSDNQLVKLIAPLESASRLAQERISSAVALVPRGEWLDLSIELQNIIKEINKAVLDPWKSDPTMAALGGHQKVILKWRESDPLKFAAAKLLGWHHRRNVAIHMGSRMPAGSPDSTGLASSPADEIKSVASSSSSEIPPGANGPQGPPPEETERDEIDISGANAMGPAIPQSEEPQGSTRLRGTIDSEIWRHVAATWNAIAVIPSDGVNNALQHAVFGTRDPAIQLSPWHLLLGVLQEGMRLSGRAPQDQSDTYLLQLLLWQRLRQRQGNLRSLWLASRSGVTTPQTQYSVPSPPLIRVLQRAREINRKCSSNTYVAMRHTVAALIEYFAAGRESELSVLTLDDLKSCLDQHLPNYLEEDSHQGWILVIATLGESTPPVFRGNKDDSRREADEHELCLGIDRYASAIQSMFLGAGPNQDFVFALFGPWGRGKSTLMRKAAELMKDSHEVVFFSAVKYPSRPEVWVHLYQTMVKAATKTGFWSKWRVRFRIGLLRVGWWPLLFGVIAAAFSFFTRGAGFAHAINWSANLLGWIGLLVLTGFVIRVFSLGRKLDNLYGEIPDHSDKLGLQAVIGEDLERFLRAWFPARARTQKTEARTWRRMRDWLVEKIKGARCMFRAGALDRFIAKMKKTFNRQRMKELLRDKIASLRGMCVSAWEAFIDYFFGEDRAVDFRPGHVGFVALVACLAVLGWGCYVALSTIDKLSAWKPPFWNWFAVPPAVLIEAPQWKSGATLIFLLFMALAFLAAWMIAYGDADKKRVLLVVDDLDRCDPEQALSVIESIRWFLDEPKVSSRMHVAMLMERASLEAASKERAEAYGKPSEGADWEDWFQSLCEKLFMVELNMVNLTTSEVNDLMDKVYADHAQASGEPVSQQAAAAPPEVSPVEERQDPGSSPPLETPPGAETQGAPLKDEPSSQEKDVTLTPSERDMMKSLLKKIHAKHLTPRSVRAVVSRYLFARKLLRSSGSAASEHDLMKCLFESIFKRHLADQEKSHFDPVVQHLVAQLVGAEPVRRDSATQG